MECNRDEATRAKEIAEKKFVAKDLESAKKFALKANSLYPGLEGVSQMLATFDVYLAAENKINGETDWYAILCVNAMDDDETVKKQYRKLALMLHPDKNKSIGADGAFKLISEAWSVLSDRIRRMAYDQKRNPKGSQQKIPQPGRPVPHPNPTTASSNGFYNFTSNTASNVGVQKTATRAAPSAPSPSSSRSSKPHTFWTACQRCKMQYEYLRVYVNHNLLCPNCHEAFKAIELGSVPTNGSNSSVPWSFTQQRSQDQCAQNPNQNMPNRNTYTPARNPSATSMGTGGFPLGPGLDAFNNINFQWGPFSRTTGVASATASSSAAAAAANVVHLAYEKVRREREEAHAAAKREEARRNHALKRSMSGMYTGNSSIRTGGNECDRDRSGPKVERPAKKRRSTDEDGGGNDCGNGDKVEYSAMGNGRTGAGNMSGFRANTANRHFNTTIDGIQAEKANGVPKNPFCGLSMDASKIYRAATAKPNNNLVRELSLLETRNMLMEKARMEIRKKLKEWSYAASAKSEEKKPTEANGDARDQSRPDESTNSKKQEPPKIVPPDVTSGDSDTETAEPISINVPDPDFHDFDKDRSERSFEANQVWAAYDDDDGMPRFYALIQKVISLKPFKMRISWLNSKSNSELGPLNWVGSGFTKTCGEFRVGRYEVNDTVNVFSHKVRWEKGLRGAVKIIPREGDVWALYRNWSPDWNEFTNDEVIHKYDMVEVLYDYNEEHGVSVALLVKVAGFKTVFHRHMDSESVRRIPREEMFRFSHQVPSLLLTGEEGKNAPKGCWELDPAATPVELLQVITEAKDEAAVDTAIQEQVG